MRRNDTIAQMFEEIRPMVFNFARKFNLEFDDSLQHAALIMLEAWPRIPDDHPNVKGYLNIKVRYGLYDFLKQHGQEILSLDAPVAPDSEETFADMLQAFVKTRDEEREDFVTQVTHAALKQCRLEEQMYAREKFGLNSFNPVLPSWSHKPNYNRTKGSMRASIKRNFTRNPHLLALMS